mgnify:CR=1 FL=1
MEVSEKCAQRPTHRACLTLGSNPGRDARCSGSHPPDGSCPGRCAGRANLAQRTGGSLVDGVRMVLGAKPRSLCRWSPNSCEYLVLRAHRRQCRRHDSCPRRAAHRQPPPQRRLVARLNGLLPALATGGSVRPYVHRDQPASSGFLRSSSGSLPTKLRHRQVPWRSEPVLGEARGVKLDELVRAAHSSGAGTADFCPISLQSIALSSAVECGARRRTMPSRPHADHEGMLGKTRSVPA